jgi:hypothetical protein
MNHPSRVTEQHVAADSQQASLFSYGKPAGG